MRQIFFYVICAIGIVTTISAQQSGGPSSIAKGTFIGKTKVFKEYPTIKGHSKSVKEVTIVSNNLRANEKVNQNALPLGPDPSRQQKFGVFATKNLLVNFEGTNINESGGKLPPDPSGAAGPNHYVHGVNIAIKIFDKNGNLLAGPTSLADFLGTGNNDGDPIILYDHLADRFFVSQFRKSDNALIIAVSDTPDPTGAYNVYEFPLDDFPDYPHYSIWPDGYYLTANKASGNTTYALEREVMIAGGSDPQIIGFDLPGIRRNPTTIFSPEPANLVGFDFPVDVPGYIVYLQDDGWSTAITEDHLKIWEIDIDFANPANSTISQPLEVATAPFDSVFARFGSGDIEQPGTTQKIDALGGVISYAANYRSFADHNSWLITFNVDVDGNDTSGIRWIELRNNNTDGWTIFQEGTYAPDDGHSRFMGSACMDENGNIGLAFNIASATLAAGIRYTGRFSDDTTGEMTLAEESIIEGAGVQTFSNRFGDYSHLTMDPDQSTFWHTAEYFKSDNVWATRIASFGLVSGLTNDVGVNVISSPNTNGFLTGSETVEVRLRNFGTIPQSNIPIQLWLDGNLVATETYTGTLDRNQSDIYVFTQTIDLSNVGQTYAIEVRTALNNDEFSENNSASQRVTNLFTDDAGITNIIIPSTGAGLGLEDVTVEITNFGGQTITSTELQYAVDGGTPVTETFSGIIAAEETVSYTFTTQVDLSTVGRTYEIEVRTNLNGDLQSGNDAISKRITHTACVPEALEGCRASGIKKFVLNTINTDDGINGCNTEGVSGVRGYADRTNLSTMLLNVAGENEYVLQVKQNLDLTLGAMALSVWIDFNDNTIFEPSEQLIQGELFQSFEELEDFNLVIPVGAPIGGHVLRAKAIDTSVTGDVNDPCGDYNFGEIQDYTVVIDAVLSTEEQQFNNSELLVITKPENRYEITLKSDDSYDGMVYMGVFNMLGQQLSTKTLTRVGSEYKINLNMSEATSGVYFLRIGDIKVRSAKTVKIIVQ
ncbi:GEVED domain-containing protein [Aquimarina sp. RZ0]|uniref:GEVED domain-containing protein n=1 Tax=Aquimarina sp. RZ0 TaxID=2607730 RepID=UPI0011F2EFAC|nr:GEVED domain-containing protein [Aquimarina sp. RZ0]KAA1247530.1 T9SS type A sorting domain-containing protein [Aquimarina sp. RZ0]